MPTASSWSREAQHPRWSYYYKYKRQKTYHLQYFRRTAAIPIAYLPSVLSPDTKQER